MTRLTARDFSPELLALYDGYAHGRLTKREFLERAAGFPVAGLAGAGAVAANWVLNVWRDTPDITRLRPKPQGSISTVYAGDGTRLGFISSDTLRRQVLAGDIPFDEATMVDDGHGSHGTGTAGADPELAARAEAADARVGTAPAAAGSDAVGSGSTRL